MFEWFKPSPSRPATAVAMVDPRASDSVLFLGSENPSLAAESGAVTRLNGQTVVVDEDPAAAAPVARAAEEAGALVEFVTAPLRALPFDADTFDVAVVSDLSAWPAEACAQRIGEAVRVLRPGGRVVLIVGGRRRGLFGGRPARPASMDDQFVIRVLTTSGLLAARRLAEADGVTYYEARKAR